MGDNYPSDFPCDGPSAFGSDTQPVYDGGGESFQGAYESYAADIVGAWSLRRVTSSYTGDCCQLDDTSDGTDYEIGFDASGDVDIADAESKITGAAEGQLQVWYDQAGSIDVSTSTAGQYPRCILDGSWEANAAQFISADRIKGTGNPGLSFPFSYICWVRGTSAGTYDHFFGVSDTTDVTNNSRVGPRFDSPAGKLKYVFRAVADSEDVAGSSGKNDGSWMMLGGVITSSQHEGFLNGTSEGTNAHTATMWTPNRVMIGGVELNSGETDILSNSSVSEVILFSGDQSANMATFHALGRPLA